MPALLKDLYYKTEEIKGKNLLFVVISIFVVFIPLGILIGNNISSVLNNSETNDLNNVVPIETVEAISYTGKVRYVDPKLYPNDKNLYSLVDSSNQEIILLRASDQKLEVVEGLNVAVFGELQKTKDGNNDVLFVEKIVVKN